MGVLELANNTKIQRKVFGNRATIVSKAMQVRYPANLILASVVKFFLLQWGFVFLEFYEVFCLCYTNFNEDMTQYHTIAVTCIRSFRHIITCRFIWKRLKMVFRLGFVDTEFGYLVP